MLSQCGLGKDADILHTKQQQEYEVVLLVRLNCGLEDRQPVAVQELAAGRVLRREEVRAWGLPQATTD